MAVADSWDLRGGPGSAATAPGSGGQWLTRPAAWARPACCGRDSRAGAATAALSVGVGFLPVLGAKAGLGPASHRRGRLVLAAARLSFNPGGPRLDAGRITDSHASQRAGLTAIRAGAAICTHHRGYCWRGGIRCRNGRDHPGRFTSPGREPPSEDGWATEHGRRRTRPAKLGDEASMLVAAVPAASTSYGPDTQPSRCFLRRPGPDNGPPADRSAHRHPRRSRLARTGPPSRYQSGCVVAAMVGMAFSKESRSVSWAAAARLEQQTSIQMSKFPSQEPDGKAWGGVKQCLHAQAGQGQDGGRGRGEGEERLRCPFRGQGRAGDGMGHQSGSAPRRCFSFRTPSTVRPLPDEARSSGGTGRRHLEQRAGTDRWWRWRQDALVRARARARRHGGQCLADAGGN